MIENVKNNRRKVFIDIGARGGILSMFPDRTNRFLAPVFAKDFRIVQFEPDPGYVLDRVSKHFGCELIQKGVGLTTGPTTLYITKDPYKSSVLCPNVETISESFQGDADQYSVARTVEVECVTISDIIAEYADDAEIWLKIDAQGIEGDIVTALGERVSQVKVVVAELSSIEQYRDQVLSQHVLSYLFDAGFNLVFANWKQSAPYENDFIFVKTNGISPEDMGRLHLIVGNKREAMAMAPDFAARLRIRALLIANAFFQAILGTGIYSNAKRIFVR